MDENSTDTLSIVSTQEWPAVRLVTLTPGKPTHRETVTAGLFDCLPCFKATGRLVDHLDGSLCVDGPGDPGPF